MQEVKKRVLEEETSITKVYRDTLGNLLDKDLSKSIQLLRTDTDTADRTICYCGVHLILRNIDYTDTEYVDEEEVVSG
uniref:Uncharacterized protein n=1 Tax=Timema tahoe TaxID=61484 RepID=A0A7R9IIA0_9NEOP|nr:unnamed protein product [Timema tahoe]